MVYRILSLDGGGSWAILQALALGDLYGKATPGKQVLANFDLAVANSGGSLVLAGLMLDKTPDDMVQLFLRETKRIFQPSGLVNVVAHAAKLPFPQFSTRKKREGLKNALQGSDALAMKAWQAPIGPNGAPVKAMISAFDYDRERETFFRTFKSAAGPRPSACRLLDVINASSTAPVIYFDEPAEFGDPDAPHHPANRYWDGAIGGYNNPVMAGIVELLAQGGAARVEPKDIRVLAIGTANTRLAPFDAANTAAELKAKRKSPGLGDIGFIGGAVLDDPPAAANYVGFTVLSKGLAAPPTGGNPIDGGSFVRLNPMLQPVWNPGRGGWDPPAPYAGAAGLQAFDHLAGLSLAATEPADLQAIQDLFGYWVAGQIPNQPILADPDDFRLTIGDGAYATAKARWLSF